MRKLKVSQAVIIKPQTNTKLKQGDLVYWERITPYQSTYQSTYQSN